MREAMAEAEKARLRGEVPIGAVVVLQGEIIGRGHNLRESSYDPSAHAELIAMRAASAALGQWRLPESEVYVTLEPCVMCAGAMVLGRVARVVYACADPKAGALESLYQLGQDPRLNHRFPAQAGVLREECAAMLSGFFADVRQRRRKTPAG